LKNIIGPAKSPKEFKEKNFENKPPNGQEKPTGGILG